MNLLMGPGSPLRGTIGQTLSANRNQLAKAGVGLGLMGLGKATGSGILGGLGGSLAGNAAGNIAGAAAGNGFMPSTGLGGFGGTIGTGLGSMAGFSYANKKDPVERPPSFIDSLRAKFSSDKTAFTTFEGLVASGLLGAGSGALAAGENNRVHGGLAGIPAGLLGGVSGGILGHAVSPVGYTTLLGGVGGATSGGIGAGKLVKNIKESALQGYTETLKKFGFASMLGSMAGAFAGPAARAGLGKVAPRMAGKLNGPIRSGIFDTAVGSAASSLATPSDKTASLNQTANQYQLDPTIKDIPPWALQAAQVANPLIHNKRMYR